MLSFLIRRILLGLLVLWVASTLTFAYFASVYLPLKARPLRTTYWDWLSGVPTGRSFSHGLSGPLWPRVAPALAHTLALLGLTVILVLVFAIVFGSIAATLRGSLLDGLLRTLAHFTWAIPSFVLALILEQLLANRSGGGLDLFPPGGWAGECPGGLGIDLHTFQCPKAGHGIVYIGHVIWHLALPVTALALGYIGLHGRYLRSSLIHTLSGAYVTTARAKGLSERRVVLVHALRNSLTIFIPALLTDIGAIFGASLAVDLVFHLNGMGTLFFVVLNINATAPVIDAYQAQLLLLIGGVLVLGASLLADIVVSYLDPRVGFA